MSVKVQLPSKTKDTFERISDLNDNRSAKSHSFTNRIAKSIKKESWGWWIIELAWTAGPATFIALSIAYLIGYGKSPANELIVYFATYTAIAAVLAVVTRVIRNASEDTKQQETEKLMLRVSNEVFRLLVASRNSILEQLDEDQRRILAATVILKNPEVSEVALAQAIRDLTGSEKLAQAAQRIESYRHLGLTVAINAVREEHLQELLEATNELQQISPQAALLVEQRFMGVSPEYRIGLERYEGFMQRALDALDQNNINLMADFDVFDCLYFTYEMLNGRQVQVLHAEFKDSAEFTEAQDKLDRARALTKQSVQKRNSRLKYLSAELSDYIENGAVSPVSFTPDELLEHIFEGLQNLRASMHKDIENKDLKALRKKFKKLKNALDYYEKAQKHHKRSLRYNTALVRLQKAYDLAWLKYGQKITLNLSEKATKKGQLEIKEDAIFLEDAEMFDYANKLTKYHEHLRNEYGANLSQISFHINDFKQIALEYILLLKDFINLDDPDIQLAVEHSMSANFYHIDVTDSARYKLGAAQIAMEELQQNRQNIAHRLARNLREYYRVALNDDVKEYFIETFGASKDYLEALNDLPLNTTERRELQLYLDMKLPNIERRYSAIIKKTRDTLKTKK